MVHPFDDAGFAATLSRRACLSLLAGLALSPATAARAQARWQIYRREDLGFEIEMPSKPKIETEESKDMGRPDPAIGRCVD